MPAGGAKQGRGKGRGRGEGGSTGSTKVEDPEVGVESDSEGEEDEEDDDDGDIELPPLQVKISMFEFNQNDRKVDSGCRMVRFGLATNLRPTAGFRGIVLSPMSKTMVSPADREILESAGIAGINCSWNKIDGLPWQRMRQQGQHRVLPFLLAANAVNYGRPFKMNTAEAIAAALMIAGLQADARAVCRAFNWGDEFLRLNEEAFDCYSAARDSAGVRAAEAALKARRQQEAIERRAMAVDLPPSSDDEDTSDDDGARHPEQEEVDSHGNVVPKATVECQAEAGSADPVAAVVGSGYPEQQQRPESSPLQPSSSLPLSSPPEVVAPTTPASAPARSSAVPAPARIPVAAEPRAASKQTATAGGPGSAPEAPVLAEQAAAPLLDPEAPTPKDQKGTLLALQTAASAEFLARFGLAGLSGNALAKLKRSEFEAAWRCFCSEEAPRLPADRVAMVAAPIPKQAGKRPAKK